ATFNDYNDITSNKKKDPFEKKFFYNFLITINDQFYIALMSPVLHYTMGEIDINAESEVRDMQEQTYDLMSNFILLIKPYVRYVKSGKPGLNRQDPRQYNDDFNKEAYKSNARQNCIEL
ncbi:30076_t:CDS:2, partial [Gigaspora margarita]